MVIKKSAHQNLQRGLRRAFGFIRKRYMVMLVSCMGITLSVLLFIAAGGWEERKTVGDFERGSENRISAIKNTFENTLHELDAIASFYAASRDVERFEFHTFTKYLLWHSEGIQALEWIPRVPHTKRAAYVSAARSEGYPDFLITERKEQGVMVTAGRRDEYYPVYFVEPYEGNENALGFDVASNSSRLAALEQSRDSGLKTATARIRLVQEKEEQFGVLIFEPVYRQGMATDSVEARRRHLRGFVLGVYRIGDLVEKSISRLQPRGIDIVLTDESATEGRRLLYVHPSRLRAATATPHSVEADLTAGMHYAETFAVAGRTWKILCAPSPKHGIAGMSWQPWAILAAGLLVTGLLSGYILQFHLRMEKARQHADELLRAKTGLEHEIDERKRAEEERRKLVLLVENSSDFIGIASLDGAVLYVNTAGKELAGVDDVTQTSVLDYLSPDDLPYFRDHVLPTMKQHGTWSGELRFRHVTTGKEIPVLFNGFLIKDAASGEPEALATVSRNIMEQKQFEAELLRVQKLESLGALAGGLAHDFNNLLTAVLGNISVVKTHFTPDNSLYRMLNEAEKASLRTKDLTQQLLTFAKGGAPVKKVVFLGELLRECGGFVLRGSSVTCEYTIPENLWAVDVDEGQMSQVINNLIINAADAMPEGGTIRITAENVSVGSGDVLPLAKGNYTRVTVRDQGIGIPQDHLQKIFDPYFTTKQKGSGLGLATSYSIVKRHGGHISAESKLGAGTAFYMYLRASEKMVPAEKEEDERPIRGSGNILVVDDEEIVRNVAGTMLNELGYDVAFAKNGSEAIDVYRKNKESGSPFSAVIMDLTIPGGMGGKEAVLKLAAFDPDVKAIVSSGYSNDPIMAEYTDYG
ncbi:MAG TPA: hypothetical protein DCO77_09555, partial [Nitrospiraceae bacterium]|nr:hypothetical protein [Nitrospiraceae bacterium]